MQAQAICFLVFGAVAVHATGAFTSSNPMGKVIQLMDELAAKITKAAEMEQKAFEEYVEWCDDASKNAAFDIKTLTKRKAELEAAISKSTSQIDEADTNIGELTKSIAEAEAELADATAIREKEQATFSKAEAELADSVDALDRAISILEREMAKNPALMQVDTSNAKRLIQSIGTVIEAAGVGSTDRKRLLDFVQTRESGGSGDEASLDADEAALGAPAAAGYKSHSSSIVDVLEDLKEKAEGELSDLRKAETGAQHSYNMLKQSLEDQIAADSKDLADEKAAKEAAAEAKAVAEGDLAEAVKDLAQAEKTLATAQSTCMTVAADHEATVKGNAEELKVIAEAKKILVDSSSGAVEHTYALLQMSGGSRLASRADLANMEVVAVIKRLAHQHHSAAMAQLASKITAVLRFGAKSGADPFAKVRGLIQELIDRLVKEGEEEAKEHAFCESEMAKTEAKKSELDEDIAKLTAKIDKAAAASARLKEDVRELQAELAELAKTQMEMDTMRHDEHEAYLESKSDLSAGLGGVRKALEVLRDYYGSAALLEDGKFNSLMQQRQPPLPQGHEKSGGAASSIIGILEVCESDFAKELSLTEAEEADSEALYAKTTQENKVTKTMKTQDVKYKTGEFKSLDKAIADMTSDKESASSELAAVMEYYAKLKARCAPKHETYEERVRRREAEIEGLKSALDILENETVGASALQRAWHGLRGASRS